MTYIHVQRLDTFDTRSKTWKIVHNLISHQASFTSRSDGKTRLTQFIGFSSVQNPLVSHYKNTVSAFHHCDNSATQICSKNGSWSAAPLMTLDDLEMYVREEPERLLLDT